jgi:hypothetical protein
VARQAGRAVPLSEDLEETAARLICNGYFEDAIGRLSPGEYQTFILPAAEERRRRMQGRRDALMARERSSEHGLLEV